jgi:hypothetical protein
VRDQNQTRQEVARGRVTLQFNKLRTVGHKVINCTTKEASTSGTSLTGSKEEILIGKRRVRGNRMNRGRRST